MPHSVAMGAGEVGASGLADNVARFDPQLMYAAARLYYLEDATQAQIADRLGTSRPTVSRLLSEARRQGIVRIEVVPPATVDEPALAGQLSGALGLRHVHLAPPVPPALLGASLAPALQAVLLAAALAPGDVLLVSSGRTVHAVAQAELPELPGVLIAPTVGGQDEPEAWYQTNEITRLMAAKVGGRPTFLYAPALPGAELSARLLEDPATRTVLDMWGRARCALLGVGGPALSRSSLPASFRPDDPWLQRAIGDICNRFYDTDGEPLAFPGSERVLATSLAALRRIPYAIALAVGAEKVPSIVAAARTGWFNVLITDTSTARALLAATQTAERS